MSSVLRSMVAIINNIHDLLNQILGRLMPNLTDKNLHFLIIGIMGLFIFIITDYVFKKLSKLSISIIAFIYTFTVLIVIVFSIEIEQKITRRGNMEFADIVAGLWGFIVIVGIYIVLKALVHFVRTAIIEKNTLMESMCIREHMNQSK